MISITWAPTKKTEKIVEFSDRCDSLMGMANLMKENPAEVRKMIAVMDKLPCTATGIPSNLRRFLRILEKYGFAICTKDYVWRCTDIGASWRNSNPK